MGLALLGLSLFIVGLDFGVIVVVVVVVVSVALLPIALYRVRDVPRCAVSCGVQPFSN